MMKKRTRFLASACATLGAMAAAATLALPAQAADKRLALSAFANVSKYSGSEATGSVFTSLGYLFTDSLEGELRLSQTLGGSGEFTLLGGGVNYYFGGVTQAKAWLPYVHASYNKTLGGGLDFSVARGGLGVDLPLNEAASMSIEGAYVRQELSGAAKTSTNGSELVVGLKFRF
jgi:hypothetical protein